VVDLMLVAGYGDGPIAAVGVYDALLMGVRVILALVLVEVMVRAVCHNTHAVRHKRGRHQKGSTVVPRDH
jgi:hypothetical protein